MTMRTLALVLAALALFVCGTQAQRRSGHRGIAPATDLTKTVGQLQSDLAALGKSHYAYESAAKKVLESASELSKRAQEVAKIAEALRRGKPDAKAMGVLLEEVRTMQEMSMSFNLQYLALQQKMQDENRRFTMLSNIMKTKHDTVKNSISNVR